MQFIEGLAVNQFVGHFKRHDERFLHRALHLVLDSLDFVFGVDAEHSFKHKHRCDDADDAKGVGGCITHGHDVDGLGGACGLLSGCETGSVGYRTRHHAYESRDACVAVDIEDA